MRIWAERPYLHKETLTGLMQRLEPGVVPAHPPLARGQHRTRPRVAPAAAWRVRRCACRRHRAHVGTQLSQPNPAGVRTVPHHRALIAHARRPVRRPCDEKRAYRSASSRRRAASRRRRPFRRGSSPRRATPRAQHTPARQVGDVSALSCRSSHRLRAHATRIAREVARCGDDAVARDEQRCRIGGEAHADGTLSARHAEAICQRGISRQRAGRQRARRVPIRDAASALPRWRAACRPARRAFRRSTHRVDSRRRAGRPARR